MVVQKINLTVVIVILAHFFNKLNTRRVGLHQKGNQKRKSRKDRQYNGQAKKGQTIYKTLHKKTKD